MSYDVRCRHCNKLLARARFDFIEVKCPRCKTLNIITSPSAIEHPTYTRSHACGEQQETSVPRYHTA
ncbi:Com family DNA-binding transcriptional regulator [Salmonella enterica]|uniref:Com family DNA-binding transcriptional regulator n=1 Tax=Salmonella enterica TaxID=28901 RepID=UPI00098E1A8F|nr:Com family DNA-binding transcriptional regulator [Salmonella enterica]ECE0876147.1 Com family DNA-binding transcriptional regulator [Salmonella enterica subsp. enterica serovar Abaetetuba]ECF7297787.1 Com family DNA-binding transcriptional regulator [Salmonella enterica subsp. enterica]EDR7292643.1 Com family DNA-binding transcriptional regulator [Salmonella enterica subsp. enterica serovar Pomona]EBQ8429945.1 Com family DNA-binding transcriptional regulator [Salmonella enterica]EDR6724118.